MSEDADLEGGNRHVNALSENRRLWKASKTGYKYVFVLTVGIIFGWWRSNYWTHKILENSVEDFISVPVKLVPDHYFIALLPALVFTTRRSSILYRDLKESVTLVDAVKLAGCLLASLVLVLVALVYVLEAIGVVYRAFR